MTSSDGIEQGTVWGGNSHRHRHEMSLRLGRIKVLLPKVQPNFPTSKPAILSLFTLYLDGDLELVERLF